MVYTFRRNRHWRVLPSVIVSIRPAGRLSLSNMAMIGKFLRISRNFETINNKDLRPGDPHFNMHMATY